MKMAENEGSLKKNKTGQIPSSLQTGPRFLIGFLLLIGKKDLYFIGPIYFLIIF